MTRHLETELIAYLRGEMADGERERVRRHLDECAACRDSLAGFREVLGLLAESVPEPPAIHWGAYRAELRERLAARRSAPRRPWASLSWWLSRPLPVALSAGLAALLLAVALHGRPTLGDRGEAVALEETVLGHQLGLLRNYQLVEQLDLLEDLDVIRHLDQLTGSREG